jgi:hypothetical protein
MRVPLSRRCALLPEITLHRLEAAGEPGKDGAVYVSEDSSGTIWRVSPQ